MIESLMKTLLIELRHTCVLLDQSLRSLADYVTTRTTRPLFSSFSLTRCKHDFSLFDFCTCYSVFFLRSAEVRFVVFSRLRFICCKRASSVLSSNSIRNNNNNNNNSDHVKRFFRRLDFLKCLLRGSFKRWMFFALEVFSKVIVFFCFD